MVEVKQERILVTVKTYPTLSRKYGETVCTAGVREDGTWVRMYPVPFRRMDEEQQYKKYDWLQCRVVRSSTDPRPETYRPVDERELVAVDHIGTDNNWRERRRLLLQTARVYDRLDELIAGAKANEISLAVFRPTRVTGFIWEQEERDWDPQRLRQMRETTNQHDLFADNSWRETFRVVRKLPYSFSYRFEDAVGKASELQILDWEAGALYWKCLKMTGGDEAKALAKVKQKYFEEFLKKDLHFYLGTTQQFHLRGPNPWVIIGVLPIPHAVPEPQMALF